MLNFMSLIVISENGKAEQAYGDTESDDIVQSIGNIESHT